MTVLSDRSLLADKRLVWAARGVLFAVAGSGALLALFQVDVVAHLPHVTICLFRTLLGIDCPGCGLTRGLLMLGQLNGAGALGMNPLAPVVLIALGWIAVGTPWAARVLRTPRPQSALALILAFWGLRVLALPPIGG
jgi:hypothetical protein